MDNTDNLIDSIDPKVKERLLYWYGESKNLVLWKIIHFWEQDETYFFCIYNVKYQSIDFVRVFNTYGIWQISIDEQSHIREIVSGMM